MACVEVEAMAAPRGGEGLHVQPQLLAQRRPDEALEDGVHVDDEGSRVLAAGLRLESGGAEDVLGQ